MSIQKIRLQPRCLQMLGEFAEVGGGPLDIATVAHRHFNGSVRAAQQRVKAITDHDLLHRIDLTVTIDDGRRGRQAYLFRLSRRGAELLEHAGFKVRQRPAKRDPRPETLHHRLGVNKTQLVVNDACALHGLGKPAWIHEHDTYLDLAQKLEQRKKNKEKKSLSASERFVLYERFTVPDNRTVTCWPDASCLLQVPLADGTLHPLIVYWEYDRSTMSIADVADKMKGLELLHTTKTYAKHWPGADQATMRIFFVVQSAARLQHIADAIKSSPAAKLVRLTTVAELTPETFLQCATTDRITGIWHTVEGECRPIVDVRLKKKVESLEAS